MENRLTREKYFEQAAILISKRSSCSKKQVGAILVNDNRIIAQGYNGVLPGVKHSMGIDRNGITHTVHAEINLIAFCAKNGIATKNTTMYVTLSPCEKCAEIIIQAGIKKVYYLEEYRDTKGIEVLFNNNIEISI